MEITHGVAMGNFCVVAFSTNNHQKKIAEYVRNQLQEDMISDQISIKEYIDPFWGGGNFKA